MIRKVLKILLTTILIVIIAACTKENEAGPIETAIRMKQSMFFNDYEDFQSLFSQKTEATKELFNKFKEIDDSKADFKSYSLITLGNGQMILINHTPGENYEIEDATIVSDEMKKLFGFEDEHFP